MKNIISIIVSLVAIGVFVLVVQPQYAEIQRMQAQESELENVLANARRLQALRDSLLEKRNQISNADIARLEKLIPESADNVKLILEFEQIAERYGLKIQAASAVKEEETTSATAGRQNFDVDSKDYGIISLDFSINGGYDNFLLFLGDVERNLRITDIRTLAIAPPQGTDTDFGFQISIETYWLKDNI